MISHINQVEVNEKQRIVYEVMGHFKACFHGLHSFHETPLEWKDYDRMYKDFIKWCKEEIDRSGEPVFNKEINHLEKITDQIVEKLGFNHVKQSELVTKAVEELLYILVSFSNKKDYEEFKTNIEGFRSNLEKEKEKFPESVFIEFNQIIADFKNNPNQIIDVIK